MFKSQIENPILLQKNLKNLQNLQIQQTQQQKNKKIKRIRIIQENIQKSVQMVDYSRLFDEMMGYMKYREYKKNMKQNQQTVKQFISKLVFDNIKMDNFINLFLFLHQELIENSYTDRILVNGSNITNLFLLEDFFNASLLQQIVELIIYEMNEKNQNQNDTTWKKCENQCFTFWKKLVNQEIQSTAYMLRLIVNSILGSKKGEMIVHFKTRNPNDQLTGKFRDDFEKLELFMINPLERQKTKRTILGFGPSSSGKTFLAEEVIKLFGPDFPQYFLSIDGGLMREQSIVYQMIIKQNMFRNISGFRNLVSAGLDFTGSIFISDIIKADLLRFLQQQSPENRISIYVPETLGGCFFDCQKKYKKYIDLTGDMNWIGLMIYQHLRGDQCDLPEGFKCTGTEIAGKARQIKQGKKYSSTAYSTSIKNGRTHLQKSPFCRLEIHNSGNQENKSIITEYPIQGKYKLPEKNTKRYVLLHRKNKVQ